MTTIEIQTAFFICVFSGAAGGIAGVLAAWVSIPISQNRLPLTTFFSSMLSASFVGAVAGVALLALLVDAWSARLNAVTGFMIVSAWHGYLCSRSIRADLINNATRSFERINTLAAK